MYQSVGAKADMVVTDASSWFYDGCNLADGHTFTTVILGEYDRYVPSLPGPHNADVLAHSPVPGQSNWSDITYYTAPGKGGGVLASGSASFVSLLGTTGVIPPIVIVGAIPGVTDVIRRAMENVYSRFGLGPATSYGSSTATGPTSTRARPPLPAPLPAPPRPDRSVCPAGGAPRAGAGMTPLAGLAPVRSTPSDGELTLPDPRRGTGSPGACWRPPGSRGSS